MLRFLSVEIPVVYSEERLCLYLCIIRQNEHFSDKTVGKGGVAVAPQTSSSGLKFDMAKVAGTETSEIGVPWNYNRYSTKRNEEGENIENTSLLVYKETGLWKSLAEGNDQRSVMKVRASAYLFCCCFFNCLSCKFCCPSLNTCEVRMRRDRWLGLMHFVCFCIHATMTYLTLDAGAGKPMEIAIYRVKPAWNNTGRNGYQYEVVQDFDLRIDYVTGGFFGLSALFHLIWVVPSVAFPVLWKRMTYYIDDCFCPWCVTFL